MPACPILRMAGCYLDFDKLVLKGIPGMVEELAESMERSGLEEEQIQFLGASIEMFDLLKEMLQYYEDQAGEMAERAEGKRKEELLKLKEALFQNQRRKPESYLEAVQLVWMYCLMTPIMISEDVMCSLVTFTAMT